MTALINRRRFLAAAAAAVAALPSGAATLEGHSGLPLGAEDAPWDIIIAGAGCGGLVCAIRCLELGLKPLLLEKMASSAGNTLYSAGIFLGVSTAMQQGKALPPDSVDRFFSDMLEVSGGRGDRALTRLIAERADQTLNWLHDFCGVQFMTGTVLAAPLLGRVHYVTGEGRSGGRELVARLTAKLASLRGTVRYHHKVVRLLSDPKSGVVNGVEARTPGGLVRFRSKLGVVIATGGFSGNHKQVLSLCGPTAARMPLRGSRCATGENIALTEPFFARFVSLDQYHCGPIHGPSGGNPIGLLHTCPIVSRDSSRRFVDEGRPLVEICRAVAEETADNWAVAILDVGHYKDPKLAPAWSALKSSGAPIHVADTLENLAVLAHLDPRVLRQVVESFNEAVLAGNASGQLVPACTSKSIRAIEKAPFYAIPFQCGLTTTFGGPQINTRSQVLDLEGQPIPGLFALGNAAGGIFWGDYIGGTQLTGAAVMGCVAAEHFRIALGI